MKKIEHNYKGPLKKKEKMRMEWKKEKKEKN